jgi:hypothetical protein
VLLKAAPMRFTGGLEQPMRDARRGIALSAGADRNRPLCVKDDRISSRARQLRNGGTPPFYQARVKPTPRREALAYPSPFSPFLAEATPGAQDDWQRHDSQRHCASEPLRDIGVTSAPTPQSVGWPMPVTPSRPQHASPLLEFDSSLTPLAGLLPNQCTPRFPPACTRAAAARNAPERKTGVCLPDSEQFTFMILGGGLTATTGNPDVKQREPSGSVGCEISAISQRFKPSAEQAGFAGRPSEPRA